MSKTKPPKVVQDHHIKPRTVEELENDPTVMGQLPKTYGKIRPHLTPEQEAFMEHMHKHPFKGAAEICKDLGINRKKYQGWMQSGKFPAVMRAQQKVTETSLRMTRKRVLDGFLRATEMAEKLEKPTAMISGWKEIGRMCGYYEPDKTEININVKHEQMVKELKELPREELHKLAFQEGEVVDAEWDEVIGGADEKKSPDSL